MLGLGDIVNVTLQLLVSEVDGTAFSPGVLGEAPGHPGMAGAESGLSPGSHIYEGDMATAALLLRGQMRGHSEALASSEVW